MADGWTELPLGPHTDHLWAHPGVAVGHDGALYVTAPDGCTVLRFDGVRPIGAVRTDVVEAHGMAVDRRGRIWVADPGIKARLVEGRIDRRREPGQVVLVAPDGETILRLVSPTGTWRPTSVALDDHGTGADGRVWVADGYGEHIVHCFAADGALLWSADGAASGTRFDTPHGVVVDGRRSRILVADRGNRRIVALNAEGRYLHEFGNGVLTSPSGLVILDEMLWVSELYGCVVAFGPDDRPVASIGTPGCHDEPGWPNAMDGDAVVPPPLTPRRLRSPHGIAALPGGDLVVAEWLLGGRVVVLGAGSAAA
ncbi:MAG: hypothetical protein KF727_03420 [Microbacteriaceae bacterium]|nr:hypothetical protein [Microbacteriaceae bacterium]